MSRRCEIDPFENSVDVCGTCFGEFCESCLVMMKRRKYPLCRECALIAAGVRHQKPKRRGARKTANSRREELRAAPARPPIFEYFDAADEVEMIETAGPDADSVPSVHAASSSPAPKAPPSTSDDASAHAVVSAIDRLAEYEQKAGSKHGNGDEIVLEQPGQGSPADSEPIQFRNPRPYIAATDTPSSTELRLDVSTGPKSIGELMTEPIQQTSATNRQSDDHDSDPYEELPAEIVDDRGEWVPPVLRPADA